MALFVVNRYLGETNESNSKDEHGGLQKLLEKIEERKKRKLLESTSSNLDDDSSKNLSRIPSDKNESDHGTKKTRKKDKKISQLEVSSTFKEEINVKDEPDLLENELDEESTRDKKKLKKDKKKRKLSESDAQISETEKVDDNIKDKQRKKKSKNSESNEILHDKVGLNDDIPSQNSISEGDDRISHSSAQNAVDIEQTDFTVIGGHNFKQKAAIKVVLPEWISKPIVISGTFKDKYAKVKNARGLDDVIVNNLKKNNIKYFFPVQQQVIPWLLKESACSGPGLRFWSRDICISAPTGSGKTLAFALPIIQCLRKRLIRRIGALVVVPVQDLAAQVAQVFSQFTAGTGLQVLLVTGKAMPLEQEQKLLVHHRAGLGYESLIDIMVTTPGRLVEHIKETRGFSLHHLKFLVIDEADRVIDNIKNDWLYHLENHIASKGIGAIPPLSLNTLEQLPLRPQKLLFSATFTQDPEKLKQINLFQPRLFVYKTENQADVNSVDTNEMVPNLIVKPSQLEEQWLECNLQLKPLILYHILTTNNWSGVLCFTHFTNTTHRLTRLLHCMGAHNGRDLKVEEISSEVTFQNRNKILNEFRAGKVDVLVCSDVYARGIDILEVRYVVLYSPPAHLRNYIHQVGRTARAGMKGTALTLLTSSEVDAFHKMVNGTGQSNLTELTVPENELMYLEEPYKEALRSLKEEFRGDKESATEKTKLQKRKRKRKNFVQHPKRKKRNTNSIKKLKQNVKTIKKKKIKNKK